MSIVCKYNMFKAISTLATTLTPIVSLASCSELYKHRSDTAISAAGIFAFLIALLFLKDKILENFRLPSPFILSVIGLIVIVIIESVIAPLKIVFVTTICVTGVDSLTFRRMYKNIEKSMSTDVNQFKKFGFIIADNTQVGDSNETK